MSRRFPTLMAAGIFVGLLALSGCATPATPAPVVVGDVSAPVEAAAVAAVAEVAEVAEAVVEVLPVTPEGLLSGRTYRLRIDGKPEDFCRDTYAFRDDGTMTITSGEEVLEVSWSLAENAQGGHALREEITATNGLPDCQGETSHEVGEIDFKYITFEDEAATSYKVCYGDYLGETCYGVAERID